jgi:hypothetical protein
MIEADRLAERIQKADEALQKATTEKQKATETTRLEKAREELRSHLAKIDDNVVQQLEEIDASLTARREANAPVVAERGQLQARTEQLRTEARNRYWAERPVPSVRQEVSNPQPISTLAPDMGVPEAAKRVGRPEASRELAEQYKINPETGEFGEQAELDQLIATGRVSEEDIALLSDADATLKSANAYGEAVKAFANCAI